MIFDLSAGMGGKRYLYRTGDECAGLTGGWTGQGLPRNYDTDTGQAVGNAEAPAVTENADSLVMAMGSGYGSGIVRTASRISLKNRNTLYLDAAITGTYDSSAAHCRLCLWTDIGEYWEENIAAYVSTGETADFDGQKALDVSALTGSYYIGFAFYGDKNAVTMRALWLE